MAYLLTNKKRSEHKIRTAIKYKKKRPLPGADRYRRNDEILNFALSEPLALTINSPNDSKFMFKKVGNIIVVAKLAEQCINIGTNKFASL